MLLTMNVGNDYNGYIDRKVKEYRLMDTEIDSSTLGCTNMLCP